MMEPSWQAKTRNLSERGKKLYESEDYCDCSFLVGSSNSKKIVKAHKVILAMSSSVFSDILYDPLIDSNAHIKITDTEPKAFQAMLKFIYTEIFDVQTTDEIFDLWRAAEKFMLPHLATKCTEILFTNPENVWHVLEHAETTFNGELIVKCLNIISEKARVLLYSLPFESVSLKTLNAILDLKSLNITSEVQLFNALERWSRAECKRQELTESSDNLRKISGESLKKIRFLTMKPETFYDVPYYSPLLTSDESLAIFKKLKNPAETFYPSGFSVSVVPRNIAFHTETPLPEGSTTADPRSSLPLSKPALDTSNDFQSIPSSSGAANDTNSIVSPPSSTQTEGSIAVADARSLHSEGTHSPIPLSLLDLGSLTGFPLINSAACGEKNTVTFPSSSIGCNNGESPTNVAVTTRSKATATSELHSLLRNSLSNIHCNCTIKCVNNYCTCRRNGFTCNSSCHHGAPCYNSEGSPTSVAIETLELNSILQNSLSSGVRCNCTIKCVNNYCTCRKNGFTCNSSCHHGAPCYNNGGSPTTATPLFNPIVQLSSLSSVRCNCTIKCVNNYCTCRKNGFRCTSSCHHGSKCHN